MLRIQGYKIDSQEINELRIIQLEDKSYQIINAETSVNLNNIHPYVVKYIKDYKKYNKNKQEFFENENLCYEDQYFLDNYLNELYEEDLKRMIYVGNFLKLKLGSTWNDVRNQLQSCQIKGVIVANLDHYCVTIYDQKFNFRSWKYDGQPYFKKWMQRNQLILMENVVNYPKI